MRLARHAAGPGAVRRSAFLALLLWGATLDVKERAQGRPAAAREPGGSQGRRRSRVFIHALLLHTQSSLGLSSRHQRVFASLPAWKEGPARRIDAHGASTPPPHRALWSS
jgi:hypothetical protein